jgi:hypothetical protein
MTLNTFMPVKFITGAGCVRSGAKELAKLGKRCLIVTGKASAKNFLQNNNKTGRLPHRSRPTYLVYHKESQVVYSHFARYLRIFLMDYSILKMSLSGVNIKIQKRVSQCTNKLPLKAIESRGYVNDGTQQLHEITLDLRSD